MKEKDRAKVMDGIIEMKKAEEAKSEEELKGVEETIKKEGEKYDARMNEVENEILDEQDRVGALDLGKSETPTS